MTQLLDMSHASKLDLYLGRIDSSSQQLRQVLTTLKGIGLQGTWLGSRKLGPDSPEYKWCTEVARILAEKGIAAKTGGGPGLMEAPHYGCHLAGFPKLAIAVCAEFLQKEEDANPYAKQGGQIFTMPDFNSRHDCLFFGSLFHIILPGRLGTIHEMYDLLNRLKHSLLAKAPVYFAERDGYWSLKMEFFTRSMGEELGPRISPADYDLTKKINILEMSAADFATMLLIDIGYS
ncbi:MAG: LOG family protein [Leptolyngbya sp.]|nr:LOG family protein [Candidatus Melainabacteria bacterium]